MSIVSNGVKISEIKVGYGGVQYANELPMSSTDNTIVSDVIKSLQNNALSFIKNYTISLEFINNNISLISESDEIISTSFNSISKDFPYILKINSSKEELSIDDNYVVNIYFKELALSGNTAPYCANINGIVYIFLKQIPTEEIKISSIEIIPVQDESVSGNIIIGNTNAISNEVITSVAPSNCTNISILSGDSKLEIRWQDPEDKVSTDEVSIWTGTKLVRKIGSCPTSIDDGTVVVNNTTRNAYSDNGYIDGDLINNTTYYYALFPYNTEGVENTNIQQNSISGTPKQYHIMTVKIDLSNSNSSTCITYADDAVGMIPGSDDWDNFFGHYPCAFKSGAEVGKLDRNNFTKLENGSAANINGTNDAMICFPRMGLNISKADNIVTVSMTNNPNDSNFSYYAHTRGTTSKDKFYIGVYQACLSSSKLRSFTGKTPVYEKTPSNYITYAQANGSGYENFGFYQLTFIQAMFLLKYKTLNSQSDFGYGLVSYPTYDVAAHATGVTDTYGMDYGNTETQTDRMKLFGIEDLWGHLSNYICGIKTTYSKKIAIGTDNFTSQGGSYTELSDFVFNGDLNGYASSMIGNSKYGFIFNEVNGSASTYFGDKVIYNFPSASTGYYASAEHGGYQHNDLNAGLFYFKLSQTQNEEPSSSYTGARLMYL